MGTVEKSIQATSSQGVRWWLERISKAALADLAVDLVRISEGDEALDGPELQAVLARAAEPVLLLRGHRVPAMRSYTGALRRDARHYPSGHPLRARLLAEAERWEESLG